jgi:uncharacterized membrane protein
MSAVSFLYTPDEHEAERASNGYLMSLVALIAGTPLPVINLLATLMFYLGNRKATYFVRWHCTQALLSHLTTFVLNSALLWWTLGLLFLDWKLGNAYIAYALLVVVINVVEVIATIRAAIVTRKGQHVSWWLFGDVVDSLCKPDP